MVRDIRAVIPPRKTSTPITSDLAKVCVDAADMDKTDIDAGGPDIFSYREVGELAARIAGKNPIYLNIPLFIGDGLLALSRLINRDIADIVSFALAVSKIDSAAPAYGTHRLEDYFRAHV